MRVVLRIPWIVPFHLNWTNRETNDHFAYIHRRLQPYPLLKTIKNFVIFFSGSLNFKFDEFPLMFEFNCAAPVPIFHCSFHETIIITQFRLKNYVMCFFSLSSSYINKEKLLLSKQVIVQETILSQHKTSVRLISSNV